MGGCCCCASKKDEEKSEQKFEKGSEKDVSGGPVKKCHCTDLCCLVIFILCPELVDVGSHFIQFITMRGELMAQTRKSVSLFKTRCQAGLEKRLSDSYLSYKSDEIQHL